MKNNIIIFEHDIQKYPPLLYIINYLIERKENVVIFASCHDEQLVRSFNEKGISFFNIIDNNVNASKLTKLFRLWKFKNEIYKYMDKQPAETTRLWLFGESCIWLCHKLIYSFKSILYLFEIPSFSVKFRYRVLSPGINYKSVLQKGHKVVCCEYNRAHVTKAYFDLKEFPLVIPNKPYLKDIKPVNLTIDLSKLEGKKVVLYQGIFNYPERKMEKLCEAINFLPNDFVICLMGEENSYKKELKKKYESSRVIFLPYLKAPSHLEITKNAYIGYLSYSSESGNIKNVLNTLFCAPNKIFEYSKFNVPMISNDVPALKYLFSKFSAGRVFADSSSDIVNQIIEIDKNYDYYRRGALELYESVDLENHYLTLLD